MCFSTEASFIAAGGLAVAGAITLKKFPEKENRMLALYPSFFALQQLSEGFVWLHLNNPGSWQIAGHVAKFIFLFFAFFFWPIWVARSVYPKEKIPLRKKLIMVAIIIGTIVAFYTAWQALYWGVELSLCDHHIRYMLHDPEGIVNKIMKYLYAFSIVGPFFITSAKRMWVLGALLLLEFLYVNFSMVLHDEIVSVWCFFAAVSSIAMYYILQKKKRDSLQGADA